MRYLTVILVLLFSLGFSTLSAQKCCATKKSACKSYSNLQIENSDAIAAAEADDKVSIVADEKTGDMKYMMKFECPTSGGIKHQEVIYSSVMGKFVCDPSKCDPADCDPQKCDLSKCDISKCKTSPKGALGTAGIKKAKTIVGT